MDNRTQTSPYNSPNSPDDRTVQHAELTAALRTALTELLAARAKWNDHRATCPICGPLTARDCIASACHTGRPWMRRTLEAHARGQELRQLLDPKRARQLTLGG